MAHKVYHPTPEEHATQPKEITPQVLTLAEEIAESWIEPLLREARRICKTKSSSLYSFPPEALKGFLTNAAIDGLITFQKE